MNNNTTVCLTLKPLHLVLESQPHKKFLVAKSPLESKFENSVCYISPTLNQNLIIKNYKEKNEISITIKGNCKNIDDNISNSKSNIEEAIDELESISADEKSYKDENYIKRENELRNNRLNLLNLKRINSEEINAIRNIKNIKLNKADYMDSMFKCGIKIKFNNRNNFYDYVKNGLNIPSNLFNIYKVEGNGNCFYRCLSEFLYGRPDYYKQLRRAVITFCKENINELSSYKEKVEIQDGVLIDTKEYIENLDEEDTKWSKDIEITASCFLFGINTAIYNNSSNINNKDEDNIEYLKSYIYDENSTKTPLMILNEDSKEHMNIIFPKLEIIEFQRKNKTKNEENQIPKPYKRKKKDELNTKIEEESICESQNTTNTTGNTDTNTETNHCKYEVNPFPTYSHGNDENLYWNIYKFLDSGVKDGKRQWPEYIENIKDKKLKDYKKADFRRKCGVIKTARRKKATGENGEVIRQEIYSTKDKYIVENDKLYLSRIEHSRDDPQKLITKKFMIPFKKDIRAILHKCHDEKNHQSLQDTFESIKDSNYFWTTMYADSIKYIKMCSVCSKKK